ncbi:MAG: GcvT family protein [Alphaproteobacteria bacterium]
MDALPHHASVIVIGGGIMGCSTLYHLAELGVRDAILLERNQLTSGTTWHSAAQVRALRSSSNLTRMIQYSVDLYARLERETGQQVGWIQEGSVSIATTPGRLDHIQRQEALAKAYGVSANSISAAEAKERWPLMNADDVLGAVWSPDDGRVSPSDVCAALIKGAKRQGASLFENTGVTGIKTRNGRVVGLETTRGEISCDAVALCAGLWSREVGAMANAKVPLLACEHFYLLTKPIPGISGNLPTLSDHDSHLYIRDDSGGLLVGCFEPRGKPIAPDVLGEDFAFGLLNEDWDHFEPMMHNALHRLPGLAEAEVKMLLNGPESFTPDGMFMLGETAETKGLFLGCGMNSVGIASGGGAGMNLAHVIVEGHTAYDLSEADAKRFAPVFNSVDHLMSRAPEILGTHYEITYPGRQLETARDLRLLPVHGEYKAEGAIFTQSYGWERPLYFDRNGQAPSLTFGRPEWFDAVGREVEAAHSKAAVFDSSSFGKIDVIGPAAEAFLDYACASDMTRAPGRGVYTAVLNHRGTYESDITAQRIAEDHYRLFVGTTSIARDLSWLSALSADFDLSLRDTTEDFAVFGLMGPKAAEILRFCEASELLDLPYFGVGTARIAGAGVRAMRMSYVGEAGWEITCNQPDAKRVYAALRDAGATPAGLYAQTSMRVEKGFSAMGHELDSDVSPIETGMARFARKDADFVGKEALADRLLSGAKRTLMTLIFEDPSATPLGHEPIMLNGTVAGHTSTAAFGYRVGRPVALAHLKGKDLEGAEVEVEVTGRVHLARVQTAPAFDPSGSRMKETIHA